MDQERRAQRFIQMNDIAVKDFAYLPIVTRRRVFVRAKTLQNTNFTLWDTHYWNIAN